MLVYLVAAGLIVHAPADSWVSVAVTGQNGSLIYTAPAGGYATVPAADLGAYVCATAILTGETWCGSVGGDHDVNIDGDTGTDADIEAFMCAYGDGLPGADWDQDGCVGVEDVAAFFAGL